MAVVLKEVQMSPGLPLELVRRTLLRAHRVRILRTALATHRQMQLMRLLVHVQALVHQPPRRLDTQSQEQNLVAVHDPSSCQLPCVNWRKRTGEFHSKSRGALILPVLVNQANKILVCNFNLFKKGSVNYEL